MIHVLLRAAVWAIVLGLGYLLLGPELFDSSRSVNPFESDSRIFLPPTKSQRHSELDRVIDEGKLNTEESAEYRVLVQERESQFWRRDGVSVEEALSGVKKHRKERLIEILQQRGVTAEEAAIFLFVVERDHPALLADQD